MLQLFWLWLKIIYSIKKTTTKVDINLNTCNHNSDNINNDNVINEITSTMTHIDVSTLGNC